MATQEEKLQVRLEVQQETGTSRRNFLRQGGIAGAIGAAGIGSLLFGSSSVMASSETSYMRAPVTSACAVVSASAADRFSMHRDNFGGTAAQPAI